MFGIIYPCINDNGSYDILSLKCVKENKNTQAPQNTQVPQNTQAPQNNDDNDDNDNKDELNVQCHLFNNNEDNCPLNYCDWSAKYLVCNQKRKKRDMSRRELDKLLDYDSIIENIIYYLKKILNCLFLINFL